MKIRTSKAEDYKELADLFTETVHSICSADYKPEQLALWAPKKIDYEKWKNRFQEKNPFLVIENDKIAGFAEFENDGHIDCFYVNKDMQKKGVGTLLMKHIEQQGKNRGLKRIYSEVSITAITFFEKHGFRMVRENIVRMKDQELVNFIMEKELTEETAHNSN
tara:strand:+ start:210 stop:698 length:489 start_codon:yes stop_codon:yes gene_type:complete